MFPIGTYVCVVGGPFEGATGQVSGSGAGGGMHWVIFDEEYEQVAVPTHYIAKQSCDEDPDGDEND